jgi:hypothetical protein
MYLKTMYQPVINAVIKSQPQQVLMSQESNAVNIKSGQLLGRSGLEHMLEGCAPTPEQPASSVYIRPGPFEPFLESGGAEGLAWWERLRLMGRSVLNSDTGIVALRGGSSALVVVPPFPISESRLIHEWDLSPLRALLAAEHTVGVILLRLGRFSVAVYQGERLLSSKTNARYVKGRHHAGGTSQLRFQRIREGQAQKLYQKTCQAVQSQFSAYPALDFIVLGGDRFTLDGFLKECTYLQRWRDKILEHRLNIRDPKRDTLEGVGRILTSSRIYPLEW